MNHLIIFIILLFSYSETLFIISTKLNLFQSLISMSYFHFKNLIISFYCFPIYLKESFYLFLSFILIIPFLISFFQYLHSFFLTYVKFKLIIYLFLNSLLIICLSFNCILISINQSVQSTFKSYYSY